jgi:hypothetical protein
MNHTYRNGTPAEVAELLEWIAPEAPEVRVVLLNLCERIDALDTRLRELEEAQRQ